MRHDDRLQNKPFAVRVTFLCAGACFSWGSGAGKRLVVLSKS
jgi:hypothetical protein